MDCDSNSLRILVDSGSASIESWVFLETSEGVALVGVQTGGMTDGCTAVANLETLNGYFVDMTMLGVPTAGTSYGITEVATTTGEAEVFFENTGSGEVQESTEASGSFTVDAYGSTAVMEISGLEFTLDGGANVTGGSITAVTAPILRLPTTDRACGDGSRGLAKHATRRWRRLAPAFHGGFLLWAPHFAGLLLWAPAFRGAFGSGLLRRVSGQDARDAAESESMMRVPKADPRWSVDA